MRISTAIALTLSALAVSTHAAPLPLLEGVTQALDLVNGVTGQEAPMAATAGPVYAKRSVLDPLTQAIGMVTGAASQAAPEAAAAGPVYEKRDDILGPVTNLLKGLPAQVETSQTPGPATEAMGGEPTFEKRDDLLGPVTNLLKGLPAQVETSQTPGPATEAVGGEPTFEKRGILDPASAVLSSVAPGSGLKTA